MAMQHIPREEPSSERATQTDQSGHAKAHRIGTRKQKPRQRPDEHADHEEDDQVSDKTHTFSLPGSGTSITCLQAPTVKREAPCEAVLTG